MATGLPTTTDGLSSELLEQLCTSVSDGRAAVPTVIAVALVFITIATVAVLLRFISVKLRRQWPTADDWVIFVALIPSAFLCLIVVAAEFDQGRRIDNSVAGIDDGNTRCLVTFDEYMRKDWPAQLSVAQGSASGTPLIGFSVHTTAVTLVKLATFLFYGKIFPTNSMKVIVRIGLPALFLFWLPSLILSWVGFAQASTITFSAESYKRWVTIMAVTEGAELLTDLLLCLPVYYISKLRMSITKKLQCAGIFSIGIICIIASVARLVWLIRYRAYVSTVASFASSPDAGMVQQMIDQRVLQHVPVSSGLYIWRNVMIWTFVEPCTSILAACLLTFKPLVELVSERLQRLLGRKSNARSSEQGLGQEPGTKGLARDRNDVAKSHANEFDV